MTAIKPKLSEAVARHIVCKLTLANGAFVVTSLNMVWSVGDKREKGEKLLAPNVRTLKADFPNFSRKKRIGTVNGHTRLYPLQVWSIAKDQRYWRLA